VLDHAHERRRGHGVPRKQPCVRERDHRRQPDAGDAHVLSQTGGYTPTHLLQPGSPAIDAGGCVLPSDQRGIPRPQGPACDLGGRGDDRSLAGLPVLHARPVPALACGVNQAFTLTGGDVRSARGGRGRRRQRDRHAALVPGQRQRVPGATSPPITAILNYSAGATRGNNAVVRLSPGGQVAVRCSPAGSAHVIIDVNGYFQ
jgi:hypothetical protein